MIVMQHGCGLQRQDWHVYEKQAPQYMRIYVIDGGEIWYRDAAGERRLEKGKMYLFPPQSAYEMHHNPSNPFSCLWVHVDIFPYIQRELIAIDLAAHEEIRDTVSLWRKQALRNTSGDGCVEAFVQALLCLLVRDGWLRQQLHEKLIGGSVVSYMGSVEEMSARAGYSVEHYINRRILFCIAVMFLLAGWVLGIVRKALEEERKQD